MTIDTPVNAPLDSDPFEDDAFWMEALLSITHRETQQVVPFNLSPFQKYYLEQRKKRKRRVLVKPRQIYASTVILAKNFKKAVTTPGTRVLEMSHDDDSIKLFRLTV